MAMGPIPVDKIYVEAKRDNLTQGETSDLVEIIRRLDNHVVGKAAKDAERRASKHK